MLADCTGESWVLNSRMLCIGPLLQLNRHPLVSRLSNTISPTHRLVSKTMATKLEVSTNCANSGLSADDRPTPCNIDQHLSKEASARTLSSLSKFIFEFSGIPGMVGLHGGLPPASIFPFKSMKVQLEDGTWLDMSDKDKVHRPQHQHCLRQHVHCTACVYYAVQQVCLHICHTGSLVPI